MKLDCVKDHLRDAVSQADRMTGKNLALPVLRLVLLIAKENTLTLRSTNLDIGFEITIPARVEHPGIVALQGDVLGNFLTNLTGDKNVRLELINQNISISSSQNSTLINAHPHEDFPTIPRITKGSRLSIGSALFVDGIRSVAFCAANTDIKPEFSSIYIYADAGSLWFVATDQSRLAEKRISVSGTMDFAPFLLPVKNALEIVRVLESQNEEVEIMISKNQISVTTSRSYVTSRLTEGNFPDYKQIIPKVSTTNVVGLRSDILAALRLTTVVSGKMQQVRLKAYPEERVFEVEARNSDIGESTTRIPTSISGDPVEMLFNLKLLMDVFQVISTDSIGLEFNSTIKVLILRGVSDASFCFLLKPLRG